MDKRQEKRCDELFKLNMMFNGTEFIGTKPFNKDFRVHHLDTLTNSDEEWEKLIQRLKIEYDKREKGK